MKSRTIYEVLKDDHVDLKNIFKMIKSEKEGGAEKRRKIFKDLFVSLLTHIRAENKAFYNVLRGHKSLRKRILASEEEHQIAENLLYKMDDPLPQDHWDALFEILRENVLHHFREEENKVFSSSRKVVDRNLSIKMGENFLRFKEQFTLDIESETEGEGINVYSSEEDRVGMSR